MITKEDIISLGWEYFMTANPPTGKEVIYQKANGCHKMSLFNGFIEIWDADRHGSIFTSHNIGLCFYGKLITDNPKEELETIMKQIGII